MRCTGFAAFAVLIAVPAAAETESCRGHPQTVQIKIKRDVEALRMLEREAADRLLGLDTRTFEYLLAQTNATADAIAGEQALAEEKDFKACPNETLPIRTLCREAATALARVLTEQAAGGGTKVSRRGYAEAMPKCESALGFVPLSTVLRVRD